MNDTPFLSRLLFSGLGSISILFFGLEGCSRPTALPTEREGHATVRELKTAGGSRKTDVQIKEFTLLGEVKKVDREAHEISIKHEKITGFMEAMTMPFRIVDNTIFENVKPGDQVKGKLRVKQENGNTKEYQLVDLRVVQPAQGSSFVLGVSGPEPQLRARPRILEPGEIVPDFAMTGQDGNKFQLSELRGYVVVLTFIYTRCPLPDFCPAMDRKFSDLAQTVGAFPERAAKIRLLSVSFDPEHDTPEILRKHAKIQGAVPPLWSFAVASHEELARVTGPLGLMYGPRKDDIMHNLCTVVIDPNGLLARLEIGTQKNKWSSAELLKTIYSLIPAFQK